MPRESYELSHEPVNSPFYVRIGLCCEDNLRSVTRGPAMQARFAEARVPIEDQQIWLAASRYDAVQKLDDSFSVQIFLKVMSNATVRETVNDGEDISSFAIDGDPGTIQVPPINWSSRLQVGH